MGHIIDLSGLLEPYKGKWVIISQDKHKVLFSADSMQEVLKKSEGYKDSPILLRVPDEHTAHLL